MAVEEATTSSEVVVATRVDSIEIGKRSRSSSTLAPSRIPEKVILSTRGFNCPIEATTKDLTGRGRALIHPEIDSIMKDLIKLREDVAMIPKGLVVSGELDSEESQLGLDDEKESKGNTSLDLTSSSLLSLPSNLMNGSTRPKAKFLTWLENVVLIISEIGSSIVAWEAV